MRRPIRPNANTAECWLLQCFTIPTALRISGSGISRPLFPIHGVLRASVVSLQLVEQWCGFLVPRPADRSGRVGETERQQRSYSPAKARRLVRCVLVDIGTKHLVVLSNGVPDMLETQSVPT
jgi:hypothetical protein